MSEKMIHIDSKLWNAFVRAVAKQGKKPQTVLAKLIRDYMETQEDEALFREMRRDVRGREMTDAEAVDFVHKYRREKSSVPGARQMSGRRVVKRTTRSSYH